MRYATYYYESEPAPVSGIASGIITITGSAVGSVTGGDVFTYEAADILPWDVDSRDELPMSIESADLTPLAVSS